MRSLPLLVALAACAGPTPTHTDPPLPAKTDPTPTPPPDDKPAPLPIPSTPGLGEKCGVDGACAQRATCMTYYGIAGPSGPAFKTCEIKCSPTATATACPADRKCTTIADGPGSVCR